MDYKNELPDNCPSDSIPSIKSNKMFYRVTKNSPPCSSDFIPLWYDGRGLSAECLAKGISISEKLEDAKNLKKMFKKMGQYTYSGIIKYQIDGIVSLTPNYKNPSHRTWYPYKDTIEIQIFMTQEV